MNTGKYIKAITAIALFFLLIGYSVCLKYEGVKLKNENIVVRVVPVINDWMRPWSPIRCMISPMFFASKKRIGSLISLARKSEIRVILIRVFMCRLIQL